MSTFRLPARPRANISEPQYFGVSIRAEARRKNKRATRVARDRTLGMDATTRREGGRPAIAARGNHHCWRPAPRTVPPPTDNSPTLAAPYLHLFCSSRRCSYGARRSEFGEPILRDKHSSRSTSRRHPKLARERAGRHDLVRRLWRVRSVRGTSPAGDEADTAVAGNPGFLRNGLVARPTERIKPRTGSGGDCILTYNLE